MIRSLTALVLLSGAAMAHDGYERYRNPVTGISCCNNQDCRPMPADEVEARLREIKGGVTVDGVFVEDAQIQEGPDGRWHIRETKQRYLFCVLRPRPSF